MSWFKNEPVNTGTPDNTDGKPVGCATVDTEDGSGSSLVQYIPYQLPRYVNAKFGAIDTVQSLLMGDFSTVDSRYNLYELFNSAATGDLGFVFFGHVGGVTVSAYYTASAPDATAVFDFIPFFAEYTVSEMFDWSSESAVHSFLDTDLYIDAITTTQRVTFTIDSNGLYYQNGTNTAYYFSLRETIDFGDSLPSGMIIIPRTLPTNCITKIGVTVTNTDGFIYGDSVVPSGNTPSFSLGGVE